MPAHSSVSHGATRRPGLAYMAAIAPSCRPRRRSGATTNALQPKCARSRRDRLGLLRVRVHHDRALGKPSAEGLERPEDDRSRDRPPGAAGSRAGRRRGTRPWPRPSGRSRRRRRRARRQRAAMHLLEQRLEVERLADVARDLEQGLEVALGVLAVGHVAEVGDDRTDARVVQEVLLGHLDPQPRAVAVREAILARDHGARRGEQPLPVGEQARAVLGVHGVDEAAPSGLVGLPAARLRSRTGSRRSTRPTGRS